MNSRRAGVLAVGRTNLTRDRTVSGGQTRYEQRAEKLAVGRLAINRGQECWQLAGST